MYYPLCRLSAEYSLLAIEFIACNGQLYWGADKEDVMYQRDTFEDKAVCVSTPPRPSVVAQNKVLQNVTRDIATWHIQGLCRDSSNGFSGREDNTDNLEPHERQQLHRGLYSSDDANVYKITDDTYAALHPSLNVRTPQRREEFLSALRKGLCAREKKANGVKFLGGIAELKINGDARLWTDRRYLEDGYRVGEKQGENNAAQSGRALLLFDNEGNHSGVKRAAESGGRLQYITFYLCLHFLPSTAPCRV